MYHISPFFNFILFLLLRFFLYLVFLLHFLFLKTVYGFPCFLFHFELCSYLLGLSQVDLVILGLVLEGGGEIETSLVVVSERT